MTSRASRAVRPAYFGTCLLEDNAFLLLETTAGQMAFLHASWTEWKNLFSFEICGRDGKLEITGLGGSYGTERLTFYKMHPEMGPPETTAWERFPVVEQLLGKAPNHSRSFWKTSA